MMKVPVISLDVLDTDDEDGKTKSDNFRRNGSVRKVREIQLEVAFAEPPSSPSTLNTVISRFGRSQSLRRPPVVPSKDNKENCSKNLDTSPGSSRGASPTPSFIDISPMIRTASLRVKNQLTSRLSEPLKKAESRISRLLTNEPDEDDPQFQHYSLVHGLQKGCNNNNHGEGGCTFLPKFCTLSLQGHKPGVNKCAWMDSFELK
uniref:Uncharacterized protein n=2 Tax=Caenorhabditis japonica TaxID=281687 RepID=A0A8R1E7D0_CAEJA